MEHTLAALNPSGRAESGAHTGCTESLRESGAHTGCTESLREVCLSSMHEMCGRKQTRLEDDFENRG